MSGCNRKNCLKGQFIIDAYDKDKNHVGHGESKLGDLLLKNFGLIFAVIFEPQVQNGGASSSYFVDINGNTRTVGFYSSTLNQLFNDTAIGALGPLLGVGSSSTAPTRTDVTLGSLLGAWTAADQPVALDTVNWCVPLTASITLASGGTINEAGVAIDMNTLGTIYRYLICRDLISPPVTIPVSGTAAGSWNLYF